MIHEMKVRYPSIGLVRICRLLGITRQAFYQHFWRLEGLTVEEDLVLNEVMQIRQKHPVIGCRKLYCMLQTFLLEHQIKMGRDALFDLLASNKLLIRRKKEACIQLNPNTG